MDNGDLDGVAVEAIAKFTETLDQTPGASVEDFLRDYPMASSDLRAFLETVVRVRNSLAHIRLTPEASGALFKRVRGRVARAVNSAGAVVMNQRPDVMILLLYFMRKLLGMDIWGNTKLMKLLFLLGKEGQCDQLVPDFYDHYAYSYGAFDDAVPKDAAALADKKIINMGPPEAQATFGSEELGIPNEKKVDNVYRLTAKGERFAEALLKDAVTKNPNAIKKMKEVICAYGKKSTDELLAYTYHRYPETAEKSKVKDKYLKKKSNDGNCNGF